MCGLQGAELRVQAALGGVPRKSERAASVGQLVSPAAVRAALEAAAVARHDHQEGVRAALAAARDAAAGRHRLGHSRAVPRARGASTLLCSCSAAAGHS